MTPETAAKLAAVRERHKQWSGVAEHIENWQPYAVAEMLADISTLLRIIDELTAERDEAKRAIVGQRARWGGVVWKVVGINYLGTFDLERFEDRPDGRYKMGGSCVFGLPRNHPHFAELIDAEAELAAANQRAEAIERDCDILLGREWRASVKAANGDPEAAREHRIAALVAELDEANQRAADAARVERAAVVKYANERADAIDKSEAITQREQQMQYVQSRSIRILAKAISRNEHNQDAAARQE